MAKKKPDRPLSPSGWVVLDRQGRNGKILYKKRRKKHCTWCAKPVTPPRQSWCSKECTEFYERTQVTFLRRLVYKRDGGECVLCKRHQDAWQMDHTIAIHNGGPIFALSNLRTLCVECHKRKTSEEATARAIKRRQND